MYGETSSYCLSARYYTALQEQLTVTVLKSKFQRHSRVVEDMLRRCQILILTIFVGYIVIPLDKSSIHRVRELLQAEHSKNHENVHT